MSKPINGIMPKKKKYSDGHAVEFLTLAFVSAELFDRYTVDHPVVANTPKLAKKAAKISALLHDFYQDIGAVVFDEK